MSSSSGLALKEAFVDSLGLLGDERREAAFAVRLLTEQDWSGAANDVSLNWAVRSPLRAYAGNETGNFPEGGYVRLVEAMASGLDIRLGHAVTRIEHGPEGVVVHAQAAKHHERDEHERGHSRHDQRRRRDGHRREHGERKTRVFRASHVIVAVPLGVLKAGSIRFDPLLPIPKQRSIERLGFGFFEKVALRFPEPFWQAGGHTHLLYLSQRNAMEYPLFVDLQRFLGEPALMCLMAGGFARSQGLMDKRVIHRRVLEILKEVYGSSIPRPTDIALSRWQRDPFSRGAYSFFPVGAVPEDMHALAAPVNGRLLFAGEATTRRRFGYADGALTTGVREAKRLLGESTVRLRPLGRDRAGNRALNPLHSGLWNFLERRAG